jgi:DNA-binding HxlR family transcriptional regulator
MLKRNYDGQESCSVAQVLEIIGERWTWLIIRDAFLGITKFIDFEQSLGIARNVLTDRLNRLVDEGIFERVLYQERPARYEYRLTPKGADLFTALNALRQWGDQYLTTKPMRLLRRKNDKTPVIAALVPEGAPILAADEIELVPGPGFRTTCAANDPQSVHQEEQTRELRLRSRLMRPADLRPWRRHAARMCW